MDKLNIAYLRWMIQLAATTGALLAAPESASWVRGENTQQGGGDRCAEHHSETHYDAKQVRTRNSPFGRCARATELI
jgi:hypothetical protein